MVRKATGPGTQIVVRVHKPLLAAIDRFRAGEIDSPSRPEALRRLAAQALAAMGEAATPGRTASSAAKKAREVIAADRKADRRKGD
jgi:hypothetical protein